MSDLEFKAAFTLEFQSLTCDEVMKLSRYLSEGPVGEEWGKPKITINCELTGERASKHKGKVSKEDLLAIEKKEKK